MPIPRKAISIGSVCSRETERSRKLVVNFVDVFVKVKVVENAVTERMRGIFKDEEDGALPCYGVARWEESSRVEAN